METAKKLAASAGANELRAKAALESHKRAPSVRTPPRQARWRTEKAEAACVEVEKAFAQQTVTCPSSPRSLAGGTDRQTDSERSERVCRLCGSTVAT